MRDWLDARHVDTEHLDTAYGAFALVIGVFAAVSLLVGVAVVLAWIAETAT